MRERSNKNLKWGCSTRSQGSKEVVSKRKRPRGTRQVEGRKSRVIKNWYKREKEEEHREIWKAS